MLLELENEEILKLIEDPKCLEDRANEAVRVYENYLVSIYYYVSKYLDNLLSFHIMLLFV